MDWVQQKEGGRRRQKRKMGATPTSKKVATSASLWLEDLCAESISALQHSLPAFRNVKSTKRNLPLSALQWGLETLAVEDRQDSDRLATLLTYVDSTTGSGRQNESEAQELAEWISKQLPSRHDEACVALTAAGWIQGLHALGKHIKPVQWLDTLQSILSQVDRSWADAQPLNLLTWLIWSCEIPLALATQLSQLGAKDRVVCETLDRLAGAIEAAGEVPDGWLADGTRHLRSLLACVYRCRRIADALGARTWYRPQRDALANLARLAVECSDRYGNCLFTVPTRPVDERFWLAIHELCGKPDSLARLIRHNISAKSLKKLAGKEPAADTKSAGCSFYNEKASLAWMRHAWNSHSGRVAVEFGSDEVWLNLIGSKGNRLITGMWETSVLKDDLLLEQTTSWKEVCWFTDKEVDAIELECHFGEHARLQRQILFMRKESLVFLADALLGSQLVTWKLESRLPLAEGYTLNVAKTTRESELVSHSRKSKDRVQGLVVPLAFSEWRRDSSAGELIDEPGFVSTFASAHAKHIYLPLAIAMKPGHRKQKCTWRKLSIAENMQHVDGDIASAVRLQIGGEQWVFYRSLSETRKRSTLGLHLHVEFYAGRFDSRTGKHHSLIEVESG